MVFWCFMVWMFVLLARPQDVFVSLESFHPSLTIALICLLMIVATTSAQQWKSIWQHSETKTYLLFYVVMILGIPFAYHRRVAFEYIFFLDLMNLLFFIAFVLMMTSTERLKKGIILLVYVSLFYSVFGLAYGTFREGRFFVNGSMFDPNDMAYLLVSLLPFCVFCLLIEAGWINRLVSIAAAVTSVTLILYTGSRTGVIGLAAIGILLLCTKVVPIKAASKFGMVASFLVVLVLIQDRVNIDRYLSLTNVENDYNSTSESGRIGIWKRSYDLILENPITGVGVGCFPMAIGYLRGQEGVLPQWQAAHNSYILVAAETGVIGFLIYLTNIVRCLRSFVQATRSHIMSDPSHFLRIVAGLLEVGFIAHLICAFFLTQGYSLLFPLYFAFSAVVRAMKTNCDQPKAPSCVPMQHSSLDLKRIINRNAIR